MAKNNESAVLPLGKRWSLQGLHTSRTGELFIRSPASVFLVDTSE